VTITVQKSEQTIAATQLRVRDCESTALHLNRLNERALDPGSNPSVVALRVSLVEFGSIGRPHWNLVVGRTSNGNGRFTTRKLEPDLGVSHHTTEKILRNEPVRRDAVAEFAQSLACRRSMSCRQYCSLIVRERYRHEVTHSAGGSDI
jgi:hypothetical protein